MGGLWGFVAILQYWNVDYLTVSPAHPSDDVRHRSPPSAAITFFLPEKYMGTPAALPERRV